MRNLPIALSALFLIVTTAATADAATVCPGFEKGATYPPDADHFYGDRAVEIIRAGLSKDHPALDALVLRDAKFEIWRGDATTSARQLGSDGLLEMVMDLKPTGFQVASVRPGPIGVVPATCAWDVTVLFRTKQADGAVSVKFDFLDGRLASASGHEVQLYEGKIR